jgi:ribonuclease E
MSEHTLPEASGVNPPSTPAEPISEPIAEPTLWPVTSAPVVDPSDVANRAAPAPSGEGAASTTSGSTNGAGPPLGPDGLPRPRRRRGSRGGRNRKRPAGQRSAAGDGTDAPDDATEIDDPATDDARSEGRTAGRAQRGHDWNDADADTGYAEDDVLIQAKDDAGLIDDTPAAVTVTEPVASMPAVGDILPSSPPRPKIGDSRPAPAPSAAGAPTTGAREAESGAEGAPKKRRRRRGGRGRSRPTAGATNGAADANPSARTNAPKTSGRARPSYVEGSLAADDADGETSVLDLLDEEQLEKRRGQMRKGRPTGRYAMVVRTNARGVSQIAVLEGRNLIEHYVSEPEDDVWSIDGNIYLGRVQNVLPGMEAAFIDIGTPKNGVLYHGDVAFDESEVDGGEKPRIERVLRNGQAIIVQVTKNPIGHKGARLTQEVSLAGRFVVMVPGQPGTYGISKRLPDDERKRLRRILDKLRPDDAGLIVRTAAEGATEEELERDMRRLRAQWAQISALAKQSKTGRLLYKEPPLVTRVIREEFTKEYRAIVIDDRALFEDVKGYVEAVAPELADRVEYYDKDVESLPIFERFHVHEQLHKALDRKVWLPSGGSLIIERTEALTVIDVNTGKNVGRSNLEETVYRNNLEAADAVARELRLRDIGGIIVIDFIDMEIKKNREDVERAFREALARDKTRTQVFPITELGLLEMTRKRVSEGLVEAFSETCATCAGRGFVLDESMLE